MAVGELNAERKAEVPAKLQAPETNYCRKLAPVTAFRPTRSIPPRTKSQHGTVSNRGEA